MKQGNVDESGSKQNMEVWCKYFYTKQPIPSNKIQEILYDLTMMNPIIKSLPAKKLIGIRMKMSLAENRTSELWRSFMQRRKEITNNLTTELFSMQVYDSSFDIRNFNYETIFEKWAAVEVAAFNAVPDEMETFSLKGGLYAVFEHKGAASAGDKTFQYIFGTWLPASIYEIDDRPHFEILGEKYKNNDPDSEEEIWIPIKLKK